MRKLREVLRLRFELKLGYQQIGRSCAISVSTVHKYLKRAEAVGLGWPLPEDWDEARVEAMVFPRREATMAEKTAVRTPPDFAAIHEQLRSSKYVTLQLLWEEYRQGNPEGYRYWRFCELYQRWRRSWTWCCARSTKPARSYSSTGRVQRFRSTTLTPARLGRRRCSWRCWGPAATPMPNARATSRWNWLGCTCAPSNISAAFPRWSFPTTPRPA